MKTNSIRLNTPSTRNRLLGALALCLGLLLQSHALAAPGSVTLTVKDGNPPTGNPVTNFRWLLEEDNTSPGEPGHPRTDTISLIIHKSHAPVVATGTGASSTISVPIPDTSKRYLLSVLADGYSTGGLDLNAGQTQATVILNKHPLPTAQISVLAFHDNSPVNNAPDATEPGIPGCHVILHDFLGGPMLTDTFGNPLGTTYQTNGAGDYVLVDGAPVVETRGSGAIYTDASGKALIKNLAMGKYGVQVIPPTGSDWTGGHGSTPNINGAWHQTATIEGTPTVDAWVKANEPMVFTEGFGVGTYHVFFGFVDPTRLTWGIKPPTSGVTVSGKLRYNHFGRPPQTPYDAGPPLTEAWIALNDFDALGAPGEGLYAAPCNPDTGEFTIPNVPAGHRYQLVVWDLPLDAIFSSFMIDTLDKTAGESKNLGDLLCQRWFGTYEGSVFYDDGAGDSTKAANGFRDPGEEGIPQQALNIRWRDGTIYQSTITDKTGDFSFTEVFPFFKWLIGEVDFARFKPTGLTAVVDEGGVIPTDAGWAMPSEGVRTPQPQFVLNPDGTQTTTPINNPNTLNNLSRTELSEDPAAPLLLVAMHTFLNQNNRIDWGKINYGPNENGGIAGIVGYGSTRAEEDPRQGTIDPWESGIPRVQMVLYQDSNADKIIDDVNGNGHVDLADIDNYPLGWAGGGTRGPEDVDRNGDGIFDPGDAIQIVWTDSWDDAPPTGSQQPNPPSITAWDPTANGGLGGLVTKKIIGNDNYSTWNQIRDGVFDGGYLFGSYVPGGIASGNDPVNYLPPGMYIVQSCPPPGYLIQTEESFNVVFGDDYKPSKLLLPPELVGGPENHPFLNPPDQTYLENILPAARKASGDLFLVPDYLSLFDQRPVADRVPCTFAGQHRPLADMKWVRVAQGKNAAADFHVYTEVPKATRVVGFVLNDFTAEYDPASPLYGEKSPPGWIPVSFRDWAGHEVARTYSDEYGTYEALLPSSISAAIPMPSGFAPNMLTLILNDPTMPDPANPGNRIPDPYYNPSFATAPWTLHYYPATFLYADTPILPSGAFVGGPSKTLDVEPPTLTPVIKEVTVGPAAAPAYPGPYVPFGNAPYAGDATDNRIINIYALGSTEVPNPDYRLGTTDPLTVTRNYGFGATRSTGAVTINGTDISAANTVSWSDTLIRVRGNNLSSGSYQLMVRRGDNGKTTPIGVTLTRGNNTPANNSVRVVVPVDPTVAPLATPIQDAIDAANAGDLILVPANSWKYNENPIMCKPVRLQGAGAGSVLNANANPSERLTFWHAKVAALLGGDPFTQDEASGILVLRSGTGNSTDYGRNVSRIDGFQIIGSISGGGIGVFDQATNLRISNNKIIGNVGSTAGGIRIGMQRLPGELYDNPNITITYNQIFKNAGELGAGGIGLYHGATAYTITNNYIEGNVTRGNGAGIGHEGLNRGGLIANNVIAYNESFLDALGVGVTLVVASDGGGIYIGGIPAAAGAVSEGAGSVTIINNLIQGNQAGVGHGGGIRAAGINGGDVAASSSANNWYRLDIFNNMIVNNVAGLSGGGISLQDATRVRIINNTIANNDCTSTAQAAFANPGSGTSSPHGGGVVSHRHSPALLALAGASPSYCNPELRNNILFQNQSYTFTWDGTAVLPAGSLTLPVFNDLAVEDGIASEALSPTFCVLTPGTAGYAASNLKVDPLLVAPYHNVIIPAGVLDEGGNRVSIRLTPVGIYKPNGTVQGDYHIQSTSPAINPTVATTVNGIASLATDFDRNARNTTASPSRANRPDIGADEFLAAGASIIPPAAPSITVIAANAGPAAAGDPPAITPLTGAGVPPGPAMAPLYLNPLPGDPLNPLLDKDPLVDSDGDGNPANDVDYYNLTAGDGWATMADGTDLYTFGFSDQTATVTTETARAAGRPALAAAVQAQADLLSNASQIAAVQASLLDLAGGLPDYDWVKTSLEFEANRLTNQTRTSVRTALNNLVPLIAADVEAVLRGIGPRVLTEGLLSANLSAPTMVFHEGRDAYLDLSNVGMLMRPDLFDPHTVHFHGFPQAASVFDGEPMASISIGMGGTLRYYYRIVEPGTYFYHCHVEATEHMQMGMIGNLWVLPKQNNLPDNTDLKGFTHHTGYKYAYNDGDGSTRYDVEAGLQVTGFDRNFHEQHIAVQPLPFAAMADDYPMLNGRGYPDTINPDALPAPESNDYGRVSQKITSLVTAKVGQRILLRLSNVSETDIHNLTVLGLPMRVIAKDARLLRGPTGRDLSYKTTSVKIGGGESTDVILDTTGVAPGSYFFYATRLNHLSNDTEDYGGLMTEIVITAP